MKKVTYDLDSVSIGQENSNTVAYISDYEEFCDVYYTGSNADPLPNHKIWKYKLYYENNQWLVDSHTALSSFNPVNKKEY